MKRREFIAIVGGAGAVWPFCAGLQPERPHTLPRSSDTQTMRNWTLGQINIES
jgi:hypothetical protein